MLDDCFNGKYPTTDVRPLSEAAINPDYRKMVDAGLIKLRENRAEFTDGGQRVITELLIIEHKPALVAIADSILAKKDEKKSEKNGKK